MGLATYPEKSGHHFLHLLTGFFFQKCPILVTKKEDFGCPQLKMKTIATDNKCTATIALHNAHCVAHL